MAEATAETWSRSAEWQMGHLVTHLAPTATCVEAILACSAPEREEVFGAAQNAARLVAGLDESLQQLLKAVSPGTDVDEVVGAYLAHLKAWDTENSPVHRSSRITAG